MRRSSRLSFLGPALAAALIFGVASPALAYVVVLKGGKRHIAMDKPVEREGHLTFVEKGSRAQYTVAIADVDLERMKEANGAGARDSYVLNTDGTTRTLAPPGRSGPSLNERVQRAKKASPSKKRSTKASSPAPTAPPGE